MKVFIVDGNWQYSKMFTQRGWTIVDSLPDADLVQFTGGADVSPALYGCENTHSYVSVPRDLDDIHFFIQALALKKPMAGICRGGQFLNVMSGGHMIQHVEGHANGHQHDAIDLVEDEAVCVTSTHHQMMVPSRAGRLLLIAGIVGERDTEAVYYAHTQCLCFQPHPEFDEAGKECRDLYFRYLDQFLFDN